MLQNYFKTAIQNIRQNKLFSAINIFGLAIGISSALVIFLIVQYDFSFNKLGKGSDRIYRVVTGTFSSQVPFPLGEVVEREVTGLEMVAAFTPYDYVEMTISKTNPGNEKPAKFAEQRDVIFADKGYFTLFNYQWLAGSPGVSITQPFQTVITEKNAQRFFPGLPFNDVIGKEIVFDDSIKTTVSGVVANLRQNTDFNFQTFISKATIEKSSLKKSYDSWNVSQAELFLKVSKNSDPEKVLRQITELEHSYSRVNNQNQNGPDYLLQPLSDLHFSSIYENFDQRKAHLPTLYGLIAVAGIILLLACINFINLTTAQSSQRAKEIGIRKTLGSSRKQLIAQFLGETFVLTFFATIVSIFIVPFLLRTFSNFIPEGVHFNIQDPVVILFLILLTIFVSLLSGIYPALILSSYRPIVVLKNQTVSVSGNTRRLFFRKTLTVSQFVIAQVFILATMIIGKQINFALTKDMGFKKEAVVYFSTDLKDTSSSKRKVLLEKMKAIPEVANVSLAGFPPSTDGGLRFPLKFRKGTKDISTEVRIKPADSNYIKVYDIKLLAGTNLSGSDTNNGFLINQKYAQILGFHDPREAIGNFLESDFFPGNKIPVVGVFTNFIQGSLHDEIQPLVIFSDKSMQLTANVSLQPQNAEGTVWKSGLAKIEKAYKEIYPDTDFEVHFLDDTIAQYYTAEQNISKLLKWATGLAVIISCLGLLGLVIYTTNQRTKEIGIRKVVGASVAQIINLLSRDFLKLVLIAFIIAVPVVWIFAKKWLQNFAFKIEISVWLFILGGLALLLPAFIILFLRTYDSARANPVDSLRTE